MKGRSPIVNIDLSGTTPSQLICWLAAKCHDGQPRSAPSGGLGPMGEQKLNELRDLALDVATADAAGSTGPALDLGAMGEITLDELRAMAQETRTLGQILLEG